LNIRGGFDGFQNWIIQLRKNIGVPDGLAGIGVDASKFSLIAKMSLLDPSQKGNPRKFNFDGALEILNLAI
jgi:alcohol dehydrogenase class IV